MGEEFAARFDKYWIRRKIRVWIRGGEYPDPTTLCEQIKLMEREKKLASPWWTKSDSMRFEADIDKDILNQTITDGRKTGINFYLTF